MPRPPGALLPFEFVVWFEDPRVPVEDEEHEWVAVYRVLAPSIELAARWGELVAEQWAADSGDRLLWSTTAPVSPDDDVATGVPTLSYGHDGTDVAFGDHSSG